MSRLSPEVPPGSCGACLAIARRRGVDVGRELELRGGHRGVVLAVSHNADRAREAVVVLIVDELARENLLLGLQAAAGRHGVERPAEER